MMDQRVRFPPDRWAAVPPTVAPGPMKPWKNMANGHGGPRPGSGRPKGGYNRLPSKSTVMLERMAELVAPEYDAIVRELITIALGRSPVSSKDPLAVQMRAIEYILDRLMGKAPEFLQTEDTSGQPTAAGLLDQWNQGENNG